jgi:chitodextrinase
MYTNGILNLAKSTNGGLTWADTPLDRAYTLAMDPNNPATLYATTPYGFFKTTNGGTAWQDISAGLGSFGGSSIAGITVDRASGTVYLATGRSGVLSSSDGGSSWQALNTGLANLNVSVVAPSPFTPTLYAGTWDGLASLTIASAGPQTLTVALRGSGSGTVKSTPSGIDCGSDCDESYPNGTAVSLSATPAAGSKLTGWGGACSGTGACNVTLSQSKLVQATFEPTQPLGCRPPKPTIRQAKLVHLNLSVAGQVALGSGCTLQSARWSFGDGATADGLSANHVYLSEGRYTVAFTVTDSQGHTATASKVLKANS